MPAFLSARARQRSSRRAVLRIAAVFIGLVMITGLAWATVALVRQHDDPVEQTAKPAQQQPATKSAKAKRKTFMGLGFSPANAGKKHANAAAERKADFIFMSMTFLPVKGY